MNKEKAVMPRLRFPEFQGTGVWMVEALGKLASYENGKAYEQDITDEGKYVVVNSRFISTNGAVRKYSNAEFCIADAGDVLMVLSDLPKGKALAKCYFVEANDRYGVNQRVCRLKAGKVDTKFLFYILNRNPHLLAFDDGLSQTHLSKAGVLECPLCIPPQKPEQQKIAECLSSVDELIAAHVQKLDALKTHKKGLMQQLFPREGETQPCLRFPEFRKGPKWEMRKIGSMLIESPRSIKLEDDREYCLVTVKRRYGGLVSRGILKGKEIKVTSQFLVKTDDFLISKRQIVHNACGLVPIELDGSVVSNEYSVLTPTNGCHIQFFDYFAQQPCVSESFMQCSVGIVIEKMLFKLDRWLKREFPFPSFDEQQRIADCLTSLDDLIAAQTQKFAALKTHKKGLMQQLFPSAQAVEA